MEALQAHLMRWMREVADVRVHGTTGEAPLARFERTEAAALKPLAAKAPFLQVRELTRRVHTDACIELDTNRYSVPWKLIGEVVTVIVSERQVRVLYAGQEVACHAQSPLRRASVIERAHLAGIVGASIRRPELAAAPSVIAGRDAGRAAAPARAVRSGARRRLVMATAKKAKPVEMLGELEPMLTRLKLTAIRDQLDTLLDQAGRAELNLREALAMLCTAEVARKDERRIQMGMSIAKFPYVRTLEGFEYDAQPSVDPKQIRELATSRWVANGDSVLLLGAARSRDMMLTSPRH
jgi:hypothetical protein